MTRRRIPFLLLVVISLLKMGSSPFASAQEVVETSAVYTFGESITLTALVHGTASITRAAVFLRPESSDTASVVLADLFQDLATQAVAELDPDQLSLAAFERLFYWWQIDFDTGEVLSTQIEELDYQDNRYTWQSLSGDGTTLVWHDRSLGEGQAILEAAQYALKLIEQSFALRATAPALKIVVYNSPQELQTGLGLPGLSHTAGHAEPDLGIAYLSASVGTEGLIQLERLLPHELTHLLLDQESKHSQAYPAWLAEGMATLVEGAPPTSASLTLDEASRSDSLLRFTDLCSAFPASPERAQLAYAQSGSFLGYLIDIYGVGGINQLLDAYRGGASCAGAVQRVYQRSLDQLQAEWESTLQASVRDRSVSLLIEAAVVLLLFGGTSLFIRRRFRRKRLSNQGTKEHERANRI